MTYTNEPYQGSEAYKCTMGATREQLECRKYYTLGAIDYHKLAGNVAQEAFFRADLELINKRLSLKATA